MRDLFEVTGLDMAETGFTLLEAIAGAGHRPGCQDGVKLLPEGERTAKRRGLRGKGRASQVCAEG